MLEARTSLLGGLSRLPSMLHFPWWVQRSKLKTALLSLPQLIRPCQAFWAKNHAVQALGRFDATAIEGSERIEEDFSALKGRLDMGKPLTFHVNLDVRQPHSWKAPYKDIKVPPMLGPHSRVLSHSTLECTVRI